MKLTPLDIRHKEFKRGMRGYADVEVDEFLDEVADEYERLFKENIDLRDRVESLEEKVTGYKRIEETLQKTLVSAQASAEEQKQNATKQAQLILQDAELKARQMANEAYSERQSIEQSMTKLRSAEEDFRFKFKTLLEGYLRLLQETPSAVESTPQTDHLQRHAEAIKEAIAREAASEQPRTAAPQAAAAYVASAQDVAAPGDAPEPKPVESPTPVSAAPDDLAPEPESTPASAYAAPAEHAGMAADQVVTPARGRGGVQAGRPPAETALTSDRQSPADDDAEVTAAGRRSAPPAPEEGPVQRSAIGEIPDLLADVDTEVNEDEFRW